jgi:hypothetical protein
MRCTNFYWLQQFTSCQLIALTFSSGTQEARMKDKINLAATLFVDKV